MRRHEAGAVLATLLAAASASAQERLVRASVDSSGAQADGASPAFWGPTFSSDRRYVAFDSAASNLVASDLNDASDVFVRDRLTGAVVRMSLSSAGVEGNATSLGPSLSSDGRFVAFGSEASNLVSGDTNHQFDVFVRDRDPDGNGIFDEGNGITTRVSVRSDGTQAKDGGSADASISADGTLIAFDSVATNLVNNDNNRVEDVFLRDLVAGTTTRVSVNVNGRDANNESLACAISADGSVVGFMSGASNLVSGDTNGAYDIFARDLLAGVTSLVSVDSNGAQANDDSSGPPSLSSDGLLLSFTSRATNLVAGDTNGHWDVFVRDRVSGSTERVSVDSSGGEGDGDSLASSVSSDGRLVAFASSAADLASGDGNGVSDVFTHDRTTGATEALSVACTGLFGDASSVFPSISSDGSLVAFGSAASNLVANDTNAVSDVFVVDRTLPFPVASWTNYGSGYAGRNGVPTLTASANPVFGATITIDFSNSYGFYTPGLLLVGLDRASIPTNAGGTLLVDFLLSFVVVIPPFGGDVLAPIPYDDALCGLALDLQLLELDPGAPHGLSFTPGLELVFGL